MWQSMEVTCVEDLAQGLTLEMAGTGIMSPLFLFQAGLFFNI
jgi:hypothetical protein